MKAGSFKTEVFDGFIGDVHYEYELDRAKITRVFLGGSKENILGKLGKNFIVELQRRAISYAWGK